MSIPRSRGRQRVPATTDCHSGQRPSAGHDHVEVVTTSITGTCKTHKPGTSNDPDKSLNNKDKKLVTKMSERQGTEKKKRGRPRNVDTAQRYRIDTIACGKEKTRNYYKSPEVMQETYSDCVVHTADSLSFGWLTPKDESSGTSPTTNVTHTPNFTVFDMALPTPPHTHNVLSEQSSESLKKSFESSHHKVSKYVNKSPRKSWSVTNKSASKDSTKGSCLPTLVIRKRLKQLKHEKYWAGTHVKQKLSSSDEDTISFKNNIQETQSENQFHYQNTGNHSTRPGIISKHSIINMEENFNNLSLPYQCNLIESSKTSLTSINDCNESSASDSDSGCTSTVFDESNEESVTPNMGGDTSMYKDELKLCAKLKKPVKVSLLCLSPCVMEKYGISSPLGSKGSVCSDLNDETQYKSVTKSERVENDETCAKELLVFEQNSKFKKTLVNSLATMKRAKVTRSSAKSLHPPCESVNADVGKNTQSTAECKDNLSAKSRSKSKLAEDNTLLPKTTTCTEFSVSIASTKLPQSESVSLHSEGNNQKSKSGTDNAVLPKTNNETLVSIASSKIPLADYDCDKLEVVSKWATLESETKNQDYVINNPQNTTDKNAQSQNRLEIKDEEFSRNESNVSAEDESELTVAKGNIKLKIKYSRDITETKQTKRTTRSVSHHKRKKTSSEEISVDTYCSEKGNQNSKKGKEESSENSIECDDCNVKLGNGHVEVTYCEERDEIKKQAKLPKTGLASPEKILLLKQQLEIKRKKNARSALLKKKLRFKEKEPLVDIVCDVSVAGFNVETNDDSLEGKVEHQELSDDSGDIGLNIYDIAGGSSVSEDLCQTAYSDGDILKVVLEEGFEIESIENKDETSIGMEFLQDIDDPESIMNCVMENITAPSTELTPDYDSSSKDKMGNKNSTDTSNISSSKLQSNTEISVSGEKPVCDTEVTSDFRQTCVVDSVLASVMSDEKSATEKCSADARNPSDKGLDKSTSLGVYNGLNLEGEGNIVVIEFADVSEMELREDKHCNETADDWFRPLDSVKSSGILPDTIGPMDTLVTSPMKMFDSPLKNDISLVSAIQFSPEVNISHRNTCRNGFCSPALLQSSPISSYDEPDSMKEQSFITKPSHNLLISPYNSSSNVDGYQLSDIDTSWDVRNVMNMSRPAYCQVDVTSEADSSVLKVPVSHPETQLLQKNLIHDSNQQNLVEAPITESDSNDNGIMYQCKTCNKRYRDIVKLQIHCKICNHEFQNAEDYIQNEDPTFMSPKKIQKYEELRTFLGKKPASVTESTLSTVLERDRVLDTSNDLGMMEETVYTANDHSHVKKRARKKKINVETCTDEKVLVEEINQGDTTLTCPLCLTNVNKNDFLYHKQVCILDAHPANSCIPPSPSIQSDIISESDMSAVSPRKQSTARSNEAGKTLFSDSESIQSDWSERSKSELKVVLTKVKMSNSVVNGASLKFCGTKTNPVWTVKERTKSKKVLSEVSYTDQNLNEWNSSSKVITSIEKNEDVKTKECNSAVNNELHDTLVNLSSIKTDEGGDRSKVDSAGENTNFVQEDKGIQDRSSIVSAMTDFEKQLSINDQLKTDKIKKKPKIIRSESNSKKNDKEPKVKVTSNVKKYPTKPMDEEPPKHFFMSKMAQKIYKRDKKVKTDDGLPDFSNAGVKMDSLRHLMVGKSLAEINNNDKQCISKTKEGNPGNRPKTNNTSLKQLKASVESLGIVSKTCDQSDIYEDLLEKGTRKRTYGSAGSTPTIPFYKIPKLDFSGFSSFKSLNDHQSSPGSMLNTDSPSYIPDTSEIDNIENEKSTVLEHLDNSTPTQVYSYGGFNFTKNKDGPSYYSLQEQWPSFGDEPNYDISRSVSRNWPEHSNYKSDFVMSSTPFAFHKRPAEEHTVELLEISHLSSIHEKTESPVKKPRLKRFAIGEEDRRVIVRKNHRQTDNDNAPSDQTDNGNFTMQQTMDGNVYHEIKKTYETLCNDIEKTIQTQGDNGNTVNHSGDYVIHKDFELSSLNIDDFHEADNDKLELMELDVDKLLDDVDQEHQMNMAEEQNTVEESQSHDKEGERTIEAVSHVTLDIDNSAIPDGCSMYMTADSRLGDNDIENSAIPDGCNMYMTADSRLGDNDIKNSAIPDGCNMYMTADSRLGDNDIENSAIPDSCNMYVTADSRLGDNGTALMLDTNDKNSCDPNKLKAVDSFTSDFDKDDDISIRDNDSSNRDLDEESIDNKDVNENSSCVYDSDKDNHDTGTDINKSVHNSVSDKDNHIEEQESVDNHDSDISNSDSDNSDYESDKSSYDSDKDKNTDQTDQESVDSHEEADKESLDIKPQIKCVDAVELVEIDDDVLYLSDPDMDMFLEEEEEKYRPSSREQSPSVEKQSSSEKLPTINRASEEVQDQNSNGSSEQSDSVRRRDSNDIGDEGDKMTHWETTRRHRWMPYGYCYNFFNKRQCAKESCTFHHTLPPPNVVLQSFKDHLDRSDNERCLDILKSHVNIHPMIAKHQLETLYRRMSNNEECFWLLKIMNKREMLDQIMIDNYIRMCAVPKYSQYLYAVFEMAKENNIQFQKDVVIKLLRFFSTQEGLFDKLIAILLYCTEDENFVVPLDCLMVVVNTAVRKPNFLNQLLPWLLDMQQIHRLKMDKQLMEKLNEAIDSSNVNKEVIAKLKDVQKQSEETLQTDLAMESEEDEDTWSNKEENFWSDNVKSLKYSKDFAYLASLYEEKRSKHIPFSASECSCYVEVLGDDIKQASSHLNDFFENVKRTSSYLSMREVLNDQLVMIAFGVFDLCIKGKQLHLSSCIAILETMLIHGLSVCSIDQFVVLAVWVCLQARQNRLAVDLLKGVNFDRMDIRHQEALIPYFETLLSLLFGQNLLEESLCVVDWAFKLVYNGGPGVMDRERLINLPVICSQLMDACLDQTCFNFAVSVHRLVEQFGKSFPPNTYLELKLMACLLETEHKPVALNAYEKLKKMKVFSPQVFNVPRKIQIPCKTFPNIVSEVVLLVEDYLMCLYNILCDNMIANKKPYPRDLRLSVVILRKMDQNKLLQDARMVLEKKFNPPLFCILEHDYDLNYGCLVINPESLQNYLNKLDKNGRRQWMTFNNKPGPKWFKQKQLNRR